jgi:hypothetical protein
MVQVQGNVHVHVYGPGGECSAGGARNGAELGTRAGSDRLAGSRFTDRSLPTGRRLHLPVHVHVPMNHGRAPDPST